MVMLPEPDLNIVCFAATHPELGTLAAVNAFVDRIYGRMSAQGDEAAQRPDFYVTKTTLRVEQYGDAALPVVRALGFTDEEYRHTGGVSVLRCTVMDPFLVERRSRTDLIERFAAALTKIMAEELKAAQR